MEKRCDNPMHPDVIKIIPKEPQVTNITNWKPEALREAQRIASELGLNITLGEKTYAGSQTPASIITIEGSLAEEGLTPFWKALNEAVPNYWES